MLRIHLLRHWTSLRDAAMEEALIEVPTMQRFAGIEMISERIPDETRILSFRHPLEKLDLGKEISFLAEDYVCETVKGHLQARGLAMKQGSIIDATWIAAPNSMKNNTGERNPEMHQTRKGKQWYHRYAEGCAYGRKVQIGVDAESGLLHSVQTTSDKVHALTPAAELLHGKEAVVYVDFGYQGIDKRPEMADEEIAIRFAMRPGNCRVLLETSEGRRLDLIETPVAGTASACSRHTSGPYANSPSA
ncbi:MAG: IS5 family transposase [Cyanobacteriota bacterium]|nr:IS5 family transposase [Cyanobacteriota bacterium]